MTQPQSDTVPAGAPSAGGAVESFRTPFDWRSLAPLATLAVLLVCVGLVGYVGADRWIPENK